MRIKTPHKYLLAAVFSLACKGALPDKTPLQIVQFRHELCPQGSRGPCLNLLVTAEVIQLPGSEPRVFATVALRAMKPLLEDSQHDNNWTAPSLEQLQQVNDFFDRLRSSGQGPAGQPPDFRLRGRVELLRLPDDSQEAVVYSADAGAQP